MPLKWFRCPDGEVTEVSDCLDECRMDERCLTLPTLTYISQEREWSGVPSTTQLLNGTMQEFLKITQPYIVDPDSRAFSLSGTLHHKDLQEVARELGLPAEIPLSVDRDIFDLLEQEEEYLVLTDYKLWGSYKVAKALGLKKTGTKPDPSGARYKTSGKWGKAGDPKMVPVFEAFEDEADNWEAELQLNNYRLKLEELGIAIGRMQLQVTVRDGGLQVATNRGLTKNIYKIPIPELEDEYVLDYFSSKEADLLQALEQNRWDTPCNPTECWDGTRCQRYCDVAMYCVKGMLYREGSSWDTSEMDAI